jgi:hypothetical protein
VSTAEGAYRCAECKSWRHLHAWATGVIEGPLGAKGELASYDYVDECGLQEDSIHCTRHMGAGIEMFLGGRWCRWWSCPKCKGTRRTGEGGYACLYGIEKPPGPGHWDGKLHEGWLPAREVADLLAAEAAQVK